MRIANIASALAVAIGAIHKWITGKENSFVKNTTKNLCMVGKNARVRPVTEAGIMTTMAVRLAAVVVALARKNIKMVTIVLEAGEIVEGTIVRKVTGGQKFVLKKELVIHRAADGDGKKQVIKAQEGCLFLCHDDDINAIPNTKKLAVDLDTPEEAILFLENLIGDHE